MQYLVYIATNKVNGKRYVGVTRRTLKRRMYDHRSAAKKGAPLVLARAIRKYGWDQFDFQVVYEATSETEMNVVERGLVAQYGTYGRGGYNATLGGEKYAAGWSKNEQALANLRKSWEWREISHEHRAILRESGKKNFSDPEKCRRLQLMGAKRVRSPEERAKASASIKRVWAERKAKGIKIEKPEGFYDRLRERMKGNQYTKGRKTPADEQARKTAAFKASIARRNNARVGA